MKKKDVINKLAKVKEVGTKKDAKVVLEALLDIIVQGLIEDDEVYIHNFGKFTIKENKQRTGKIKMGKGNGKVWVKPPYNEIKFRMSKNIKEEVNQ